MRFIKAERQPFIATKNNKLIKTIAAIILSCSLYITSVQRKESASATIYLNAPIGVVKCEGDDIC